MLRSDEDRCLECQEGKQKVVRRWGESNSDIDLVERLKGMQWNVLASINQDSGLSQLD